MTIKLSYPDPPCVRLGDLYKGECFILSRNFRTESATVYMVLNYTDMTEIKVISLNNGEIRCFHHNTNVIRMVVEINARPMTKADEDELPF